MKIRDIPGSAFDLIDHYSHCLAVVLFVALTFPLCMFMLKVDDLERRESEIQAAVHRLEVERAALERVEAEKAKEE